MAIVCAVKTGWSIVCADNTLEDIVDPRDVIYIDNLKNCLEFIDEYRDKKVPVK